MSEQETHILKIKSTGKTKDEFHGQPIDGNMFYDFYHPDHTILNGIVYEIITHEEIECDIFRATTREDGTIDCVVSFYNGGCSLEEALEEVISK